LDIIEKMLGNSLNDMDKLIHGALLTSS